LEGFLFYFHCNNYYKKKLKIWYKKFQKTGRAINKSEIQYIAHFGTTSRVLLSFLLNQEYDAITNHINLSITQKKIPINLSSLRSKKHSTTWTNLQTFIPNIKLCREMKKIQYQGTV